MKLPVAGLPGYEIEVSLLGALTEPRAFGMSDAEVWAYLDTKNPANLIDPEHDTLH
jgi:hypothetical protein